MNTICSKLSLHGKKDLARENNWRQSSRTMANKRKTALKNFRFTEPQATWLENQSRATGLTQTRIITDALKDKYKAKGFPCERATAN